MSANAVIEIGTENEAPFASKQQVSGQILDIVLAVLVGCVNKASGGMDGVSDVRTSVGSKEIQLADARAIISIGIKWISRRIRAQLYISWYKLGTGV